MSSGAANKYSNIFSDLHEEFCSWCNDFKKVENKIHLLTYRWTKREVHFYEMWFFYVFWYSR